METCHLQLCGVRSEPWPVHIHKNQPVVFVVFQGIHGHMYAFPSLDFSLTQESTGVELTTEAAIC